MLTAPDVFSAILENPTDLDLVRSLVTDDVTYVSLSYDNPDLHSNFEWNAGSRPPGIPAPAYPGARPITVSILPIPDI